MTTEELILGHFEKALTAEQETLLRKRLSDSPEARTMFDQHGNLEGMLANDAAAIAPSGRLNETVIAAALSAMPEVIGGGTAAWFSGKVAVTLSAVIIGGTAVGLWLGSGSNRTEIPAENTPAVQTAPATATPSAPAVTPAPTVATPAPAIEAPKSETAPRATTPSRDAGRPAERTNVRTAKSDRVKEEPKKKIEMDKPFDVDRGTTTKPEGK